MMARAFVWTVDTSISAAVVAGMVWVLLGLIGRRVPARGHYWLWSLVVLRLAVPADRKSVV